MNMEPVEIQKVGSRVSNYVDALLALEVLDKQQNLETVSITTAAKIIEFHNNLDYPSTYLEFIRDFANAPKDGITLNPDDPFTVQIGQTVYQAKVVVRNNNDSKKEEKEVHIQRQVVQQSDGTFALWSIDKPTVVVKFGPEQRGRSPEFEVFIENRSIFKHGAPRPNDLQRSIIEKFGKKLSEGTGAQLAIMGTATGKSFVLAGVTHATDAGIFVVPDDDLFKEMQDTVKMLHGAQTADKVKKSTDFETTEAFAQALSEHDHIILLANDKLFAEKAALIKEKVVLVDESHQHVYKKDSQETLRMLKDNNVLLAVTGTPNKALKEVMGTPMVDINVHTAMDRGYVRQVDILEKRVSTDNLMTSLINSYFARETYWQKGVGVISVEGKNGLKEKIKAGMSEDDAIDLAINVNCERCIMQKNFFFSNNYDHVVQAMETYDKIRSGTYERQAELQGLIARDRLENEVAERARLIKALHPNEADNVVNIKALEQVARKKAITVNQGQFSLEEYALSLKNAVFNQIQPVDLANEIKDAQRKQIATTMNAVVLAALFGGHYTDYEKKQRDGEIAEYLEKQIDYRRWKENIVSPDMSARISKIIQHTFPALTPDVKTQYHEQLRGLSFKLMSQICLNGSLNGGDLFSTKDIDLEKLRAEYTCWALKGKAQKKLSSFMLDALRAGLTMHVAGDKYTTGISIKSVMSTQQSITNPKDLPDSETVSQLQARNIRDKDRGAFNSQIVDESVPEGSYFKLSDVFASNSGELMIEFDNPQDENYQNHRGMREPSSLLENQDLNGSQAQLPPQSMPQRVSIYDQATTIITDRLSLKKDASQTSGGAPQTHEDDQSQTLVEEEKELQCSHGERREINLYPVSNYDRATSTIIDRREALERTEPNDENANKSQAQSQPVGRSSVYIENLKSLVKTQPAVDVKKTPKQESSPVDARTVSHKELEPTAPNANVSETQQKLGEKDKNKGKHAAAHSFTPESNTEHNKHRTQNFFRHEKRSPEQQDTYKANLHNYSKKGSGHRFLSGGRKEWHEHGSARGSHSPGKKPNR